MRYEMSLGRSVLLVDDDAMLRGLARDCLEDAGIACEEADCARQALDRIERGPENFTHLVTDIEMPGAFDGLHLARLVSALFPAIAVIVTSGDPESMRAARQLSHATLAKPWAPEDLLRAVRQ